MMRWIVGFSLRYRYLAVALAVALLVSGMTRLPETPVDVFPEFAPPQVEIQTESPGMSTVETEELLTIPLEETLAGTPRLHVMRSKTVPGLSSILLIFQPGTDIWEARQLVNERLAVAVPELPTAAGVPIMLPPKSSTSRTMKIGLTSQDVSLIELSTIAFWKIRPRLMAVPGVANVAIWGERLQQIHVQVEPELLRAYQLSVDNVMEVTADALEVGILSYTRSFAPGTGGWIETPTQRLGVQHVLPIKYPEDLAKVTVKTFPDGTPLLLSDLGAVVEDHPPLIGDAVINDGPGLLLIVEKFPWGNTLEVTRGVEKALDELRPGLPGVEIDSKIFRPATFVELAIGNLTRALLLGSLFVIVVLIFFLFEWRTALISFVAIPLSLMAGLLVLIQLGASINTMVLAGLVLAIGVVVDDAIIDIENIIRRLRLHFGAGGDRSIRTVSRVIVEASYEVRSAVVFATLIIVTALGPVFFLGGLSGAFFQPLALSYVLAELASLAVALTVTPALALILLYRAPLDRQAEYAPHVRWLQRRYTNVLARTIHRPRLAYAVVVAIMLAGLGVMPFLKQDLLPPFKETDFLMHWLTKPGTSHPEMYRITERVSRELRAIPEVNNFGAHIGRALMADEVVGIYFTENWISINPKANYDATVAAVTEVVEGYPGLVRDVQTYLKERIKEVLTGASESIVVRIYGPDLVTLRSKAQETRERMAQIDGIADLHVELQVDIPQMEVKVDLAKAQAYGLKPGDVRRAAAALVQSTEVGDIYRDGKAYDVAVWTLPHARDSVNNVRELLLDAPGGRYVRLGDVAEVSIVPTPNHIDREGSSRRLDVRANVKGRDLSSVAGEVERVLKTVSFPAEYHAVVLGEYAEARAANQRLLLAGIVAVIAIFLLLYLSLDGWRMALLAFTTLPWALAGGLLAAMLVSRGVLSLGSLVGLLTILGITTRNGIMMISHYHHLERQEGVPFGPELVLRGARERLTPILMTALAAGLALVPLVVAGDIPGHEIEYPMAIVILGGLLTSTTLNLFVVPTLYLRFGRDAGRAPRTRAASGPAAA